MQVYRGLPILTNQSPARLVGIWPLDHEASVGEYQQLAHAAIDEILAAGPHAGRRRRHGPLPARGARRPARCLRRPSRASASAGSASTTTKGAEQAHALLAELDPEAAAAVHPNDRRRVVRSLELARAGRASATASGPTRPAIRRSSSGSTSRRRSSSGGSPSGRRAMFDCRRPRRGGARSRGRRSPRRRAYALGLADVAEHPDDEDAIEALVARTRRYAAYQRKWMRRIPGLVSLPADRPPGEVADAILEVARARQRLPAGRAG